MPGEAVPFDIFPQAVSIAFRAVRRFFADNPQPEIRVFPNQAAHGIQQNQMPFALAKLPNDADDDAVSGSFGASRLILPHIHAVIHARNSLRRHPFRDQIIPHRAGNRNQPRI